MHDIMLPFSSFFCRVYKLAMNENNFLNFMSKLIKIEAFTHKKVKIVNVTQKFCLGSVENFVRKGENAGYQHFLLFLQYFQKASFSAVVNS